MFVTVFLVIVTGLLATWHYLLHLDNLYLLTTAHLCTPFKDNDSYLITKCGSTH